jgi:membrane protease YdiL (CAAX protease family)
MVLASIAGVFYGWTWRKSGSIIASAIVHALEDVPWHFLFRTMCGGRIVRAVALRDGICTSTRAAKSTG